MAAGDEAPSDAQPSSDGATPDPKQQVFPEIAFVAVKETQAAWAQLKDDFEDFFDRAKRSAEEAESNQAAAEVARDEAEKAKAEAANLLSAAKNCAAEADAAQAAAKGVADAIPIIKQQVDSESGVLLNAITTATKSLDTFKSVLAEIESQKTRALKLADDIENRLPSINSCAHNVSEYEKTLSSMSKTFQHTCEKIEGLLPGATSAGLAEAFSKHKKRFQSPSRIWMWSFIGSIAALVVITYLVSYWGSDLKWEPGNSPTTGMMIFFVGRRFFLVAPIVWLAYFAGRQYVVAQRLEEDYAYKEAMSQAFEGYKNQMADVSPEHANPSPLATLNNNVLAMLAQQPGRIYEGKQQDVTLATPIVELLQAYADAAGKMAPELSLPKLLKEAAAKLIDKTPLGDVKVAEKPPQPPT